MVMGNLAGAEADFWERLRSLLIPPLHWVVHHWGYWAEADAVRGEYVTTVQMPVEQFEHYLEEWGFIRNPVAGLKTNEHGVEEVGSWRRCYTDTNGILEPAGPTAPWQLHVRLFPGPTEDTVDCYAHWERNWLTHPVKHYQSDGLSYTRGYALTMEYLTELDHNMFEDRYA